MCDRKKREENERWIEVIKRARTEGQVWKVINKERGRKREIDERIKMKEWEKCFKKQLEGVEWKMIGGSQREKGEEEEQSLQKEEVIRVIKRLSDKKAMEVHGIPSEIWKYSREKMREWVWRFYNRI